jgi:hypothetical protein
MPLLEPKTLEPMSGKVFVVSKFPATVGREIILQYPTSAMPKIGDYATNEALMLKIMHYVGVVVDGRDEPLMFTTRQLIDNHVPDAETLMRLEWAMMSHNFAFFSNGKLSGILDQATNRFVQLITKTLTDLSRVSSEKGGQPL